MRRQDIDNPPLHHSQKGNSSQHGASMSFYPTAAPPSDGSERLLLSELAHRFTNELTIAVGLIDLASLRAKTRDARQALQTVRESLAGFARVHQALQPPGLRSRMDVRPYLRRLCDAIRAAKLQQRGIDLQYIDQTLLIDSEKCWKVGMIVFELVTNSAKHAFQEAGGTIKVEVSCLGETVRCRVEDDGSSSSPSIAPGTGLSIVNALARELGGNFHQRISSRGSVSTVTFSLS
jgi:two-component sensor histidine kinase